MSQARTNARRRKQATNKFSHLAPRQRPNFKMRSAEASAKHQARILATERRIKQGSKK
jgi:hypothetical protein